MRILLTSTASHVPPRGGSTRSNLVWLDELAARGHACRVVAGTPSVETPERLAQVQREMEDQDIRDDAAETVRRGTIEIQSIASHSARCAALRDHIRAFQPDWVLVSSEDIGQALLRVAHETASGRVVYLAHTPQFFPFGPASWNPDPESAELIARSAAIVAIGEHTAAYIRHHTGHQPVVIHPPIYGDGPFERYGTFQRGAVTMINACALKGISIFLGLADQFPLMSFGALPGWGTTESDRRSLEARPNITLLRHAKNIEQVLRNTQVLLVPSLWFEGFGLVVVEAMLRAIPVIASDAGGLVEAKMGTRFVIPVRPIERNETAFDDQGLPKPVLPDQDTSPWISALRELTSDRASYERESEASREAALQFVAGLWPGRLEEFLAALPPGEPVASATRGVEGLSAERRALLLERLRARAQNR